MDKEQIKQRFGIIGRSALLDRAIDTARMVAPTDLSVLVTGESGVGKEIMPQVIHHLSSRKHNAYIAVNCGAIPEGTIDSELFGHEKGSFTGAYEARKGYFEEANGGTIFLDEVAELPLQTQVRLLRVLETGEFIKVGSSKVLKTNVRIIAATNVDIPDAIRKNKFREDLFYRLSTVPIKLPALRDRKEDIHLLFRKFASDFAAKYRMPGIKLDEAAVHTLEGYAWPGNIRQLKNVSEQISLIEQDRGIDRATLMKYLPDYSTASSSFLPVAVGSNQGSDLNEREILYKFLFDMKKDMSEMKLLVLQMLQSGDAHVQNKAKIIEKLSAELQGTSLSTSTGMAVSTMPEVHPLNVQIKPSVNDSFAEDFEDHEEVEEESLSIEGQEKELIIKALEKHKGRRKNAASELGISERTLYRKIKEYNIV